MAKWMFVAQFAATLAMLGIIWFVQVVHYPLFAKVGVEGSAAYQRAHARLISWVVGPTMLVELVTAFAAVRPVWRPAGMPKATAIFGVALVVVIWASTAFLQVPRHTELERDGFDARVHRSLVNGNWVRTAAWTVRAGLLVWIAGRGAFV